MFTGLIECEGVITRADRSPGGMRMEVYAPEFGRDMQIGDAIAVNGVRVTVVKFIRGAFLADVSPDMLETSTLGALTQGQKVNLERALRLSDRLAGHLMSGVADGIGHLELRQHAGKFSVYQFQAPSHVMRYVVENGPVAVDGVSLIVAKVAPQGFTVAVDPQTESGTTLKVKAIGEPVNLEVDMLAKYVERFMGVPEDGEPVPAERRGLGGLLRDLADGGR
ncbi:MAG: riboflavin synthase [Coriobacteriia bacterium]|nr:riboflavin synthase [Coriobacteriia bacterium]